MCAFVKDKDEDETIDIVQENDDQAQMGHEKISQEEFEKEVVKMFIDKVKEKSFKEMNPATAVLNALRDIETEIIDDRNIQDIVECTYFS